MGVPSLASVRLDSVPHHQRSWRLSAYRFLTLKVGEGKGEDFEPLHGAVHYYFPAFVFKICFTDRQDSFFGDDSNALFSAVRASGYLPWWP